MARPSTARPAAHRRRAAGAEAFTPSELFSAVRRVLFVWGWLGVGALFSCASPPARGAITARAVESPPPQQPPSALLGAEGGVEWATESASPRIAQDTVIRLPECVAYERPLAQVAAGVAAATARGAGPVDIADATLMLRALGEPHVWPHVWLLEARALTEPALLSGWSSWLSRERGDARSGQRRCGVARVSTDDGRDIVAVVVSDALADLAPLPLRARVGQWLRLDARLLVSVRGAELLLLGPEGVPRRVPGSLAGGMFHATFSLDAPGLWRLQLALDAGAGPRPALEAWVFVDVEPDLEEALRAAPGEAVAVPAGAGRDQQRAALSQMIDGGRRSQGLASLRRDAALDDLAQAHAEAMLRRGQTAHDVGDGDPMSRVARAGVAVRRVGENVARAKSIARAHRVLWDSPSHRGNLLDSAFSALGVGVAQDDAGDVWVCELFADFRSAAAAFAIPSRVASRSSSTDLVHPRDPAVYRH